MSEHYCSHNPPCCPLLDKAREEIERIEKEHDHDHKLNAELLAKLSKLERVIDDYANHVPECVLSQWSQGEPTPNGGYRVMYAGKWYQSKPIDETPECDCGFDAALRETEEKA